MMATTAKYVRLSSEDDDLRQGGKLESNSIANQRDLLDAFISRMPELAGTNIIEFCDDGWSGKNFERPAVQDLLQQARQGKIQCIIVKDDCVITELNAKSQIKCGFCAVSSIFWPKTGKGKVQGGTRRVVCPPA